MLERFLGAGRGLLAAHEAGLVHRDFKPANVLVSQSGRVWVTDFGLARPVDLEAPREELPETIKEQLPEERRVLGEQLTQAGVVVGTPNYMSPEQYMNAELDSRSDQFSFCVSLYWGLYRKRPFETARMRAFAATSRRQRPGPQENTTPMKPGALARVEAPLGLIQEPPRDTKVPTWVRQALMKGMALNPSERFASMKELLEALSQERRNARQRRWVAAACATTAVVAVVGGGVYHQSRTCSGVGGLMAEVWTPEARGRLESSFQATGKPFAQETAGRVVAVLEDYASHWTQQRAEVCQATHASVVPEELLGRRVACLERRREDMRAVVGVLAQADGPLVEKALDTVHALPDLRECADVEGLAEQQRLPSDPVKREEIAQLGKGLAEVKALVDAGRLPTALDKAKALEPLVVATGHLPLMAELRYHLGWLREQEGASGESSKLLARAVYDAEAGRADRLKVSVLNKLLFVEDGQKHFDQAEDWAGLAEATLQRLGGDAMLESDVLVNRANLAISRDRFPEALSLLEQARTLQNQSLPAGHPKRARTTFLLGRITLEAGERDKALALLEESLQQTQASVGALHPDMARRHGLLSYVLRDMGDFTRALGHARAAADIREATFGRDHFETAKALDEVGMCLLGLKRYDEALGVYQHALAIKSKVLPAGDEGLQYTYDGVGQALLGLGRAREAVEPLRQAVAFTSVRPEVLAESGFALARALWVTGDKPEARGEAAHARERFTQAGMAPRANEVDAWLGSLPPEPKSLARPVRPVRRPTHR